ncbi:hypothetical protein [Streptomyces niveus]|uniref:hypothetical protein n=1 Tax=Streptomyces niveus TaxID=193462 RepID=UPI0036D2B624
MPLVVTVQQDSRDACAADLARVCALLDLTPILLPRRWVGSERWMARATQSAPAGEGQGREG